MEVIVKPRGHGKTTKALILAKETNAQLVVSHRQEADRLNYDGQTTPIFTYDDVVRGRFRGHRNKDIIVDDADLLIRDHFPGLYIVGVTITGKCPNLKKQDKWLPIETAPKDGTRILAAFDDGKMCVVRWVDKLFYSGWTIYFNTDKYIFWIFGKKEWLIVKDVKYWMPLPKPPEKK